MHTAPGKTPTLDPFGSCTGSAASGRTSSKATGQPRRGIHAVIEMLHCGTESLQNYQATSIAGRDATYYHGRCGANALHTANNLSAHDCHTRAPGSSPAARYKRRGQKAQPCSACWLSRRRFPFSAEPVFREVGYDKSAICSGYTRSQGAFERTASVQARGFFGALATGSDRDRRRNRTGIQRRR